MLAFLLARGDWERRTRPIAVFVFPYLDALSLPSSVPLDAPSMIHQSHWNVQDLWLASAVPLFTGIKYELVISSNQSPRFDCGSRTSTARWR